MPAPDRHWFRRGFCRREWESLRCGLFNIRHPWRLTRSEWGAHAKLFAMNVASIIGGGAILFCLVALLFGVRWGSAVAAMGMMAMTMAWLSGQERKRSPLWPRHHGDATQGSGAPPRIQGTALAPRSGRR